MLVHSLKGVPTALTDGCIITGISEREDPLDALVVKKGAQSKTLQDFPVGGIVDTSNTRRLRLNIQALMLEHINRVTMFKAICCTSGMDS